MEHARRIALDTASEYDEIEREVFVDPATGEIIERFEENPSSVSLDMLSQVMRGMRANQRKIALIEEFEAQESERIRAACRKSVAPMEEALRKLSAVAEHILRSSGLTDKKTGRPKISCPGIGTVRIDLTRERVDDTKWREMSEEEQRHLANVRQLAIRVVSTYKPDKATIKKQVLDGDEMLSKAFSVVGKEETFVFRPAD